MTFSSAQPSILTPPVDATVCLNSIAEFTCSTDGESIEWRLNGTGADAFAELQSPVQKFLHPGIEEILLVPGIHKFENTGITCTGGTFGVGSSTSDPVQLFVQGTCTYIGYSAVHYTQCGIPKQGPESTHLVMHW